ncbi:integral membrane protein 2Ca [Electrophorus electricus]|uniref:Integral membrane protein 2 n=1 Tax=Electrophorus electricus TaxID=8005 RepID=A0A4W4GFR0_ELEEL|nr:integral membrane protein 2Ca [Electrophorus electricus]
MVKISFKAIAGQKTDKDEGDGDKTQIYIQHPHEELILRGGRSRSSLSGLCCLTTALIICTCSLIYASIYIYRYYITPQAPDQSEFHCHVTYENAVSAPQRGAEALEENVGIYLQENYEQISVPVARFSNADPATIIHDFNRGLTAYHDIALDKCYITELNTTIVMPPRNLWELLINVKLRTKHKGISLPQTYIIQEEMIVTGKIPNTQQFGMFIHRLCNGKDTYQLTRRITRRRIFKREAQNCHPIRHFENTFVVETMICDAP